MRPLVRRPGDGATPYGAGSALGKPSRAARAGRDGSDGLDLGDLRLLRLVDLLLVLLQHVLDLRLELLVLVLGDAAVGVEAVDVLVEVAPRVAHRDARLLADLLHLRGVLRALLARERRQRDADDLAVALRRGAEVALAHRLHQLLQRRG